MARSSRRSESPFDFDTELLKNAQTEPHGEVFAQLFEYYSLRLVQYFLSRNLSEDDAEELAQEVMIKVFRALPRYEIRETQFSGWVFFIARNLLSNFFRDLEYESKILEFVSPEEVFYTNLPDPSELLEEQLEKNDPEITRKIQAALDKIPDLNREVVINYVLKDLSHKQIAKKLQLTEVGSKVRFLRAREKLSKLLQDLR